MGVDQVCIAGPKIGCNGDDIKAWMSFRSASVEYSPLR